MYVTTGLQKTNEALEGRVKVLEQNSGGYRQNGNSFQTFKRQIVKGFRCQDSSERIFKIHDKIKNHFNSDQYHIFGSINNSIIPKSIRQWLCKT